MTTEDLAFASGGQAADWNYALSAFKPYKENGPVQFSADQAWVVKEKAGNEDLSIIHIQDAHQKIGAQFRIAEMLERLVSGYDLRLASVEGAAGEVDPGIVSAFPRAGARRVLAESMLRLGSVSAAEFQAMVSEKPLKLYGAEEESLYDANVEVFKRIVDRRPELNRGLAALKAALETVRDRALPPHVLVFLKGRISRGDASSGVSARWAEYRDFAAKAGVDPDKHPSLKLFSEALDLEKQIDFAAAGAQRDALMAELAKKLGREELRELVLEAVKYRAMKMPPAAFHASVARRALAAGIPAESYPEFVKYARYLALFESIDIQAVFSEITALEDEMLRESVRAPKEKAVLDLLERAETMARVLKTSATSAEHARFLSDPRHSLAAVREDFDRACAEYGVKNAPGPEAWGLFEKALADDLEFYEKADQRSRALVAKTVERMKKENVRVAALVAGGFHSEELSKLMDERRLSYLVVMPKFDESEGDRPYVTVLTKRPQAYEEAFKDSGFFLADPAFFTPRNFGPDGMAALVAALLVADRISGEAPVSKERLFSDYLAQAPGLAGKERAEILSKTLEATDEPRRVAEGLYEVTAGGRLFEVPVDTEKKTLTSWPREKKGERTVPAAAVSGRSRQATAEEAAFFANQWALRVSTHPIAEPSAGIEAEMARFERVKSIRFTPAQKEAFLAAARLAVKNVSGEPEGEGQPEGLRVYVPEKTVKTPLRQRAELFDSLMRNRTFILDNIAVFEDYLRTHLENPVHREILDRIGRLRGALELLSDSGVLVSARQSRAFPSVAEAVFSVRAAISRRFVLYPRDTAFDRLVERNVTGFTLVEKILEEWMSERPELRPQFYLRRARVYAAEAVEAGREMRASEEAIRLAAGTAARIDAFIAPSGVIPDLPQTAAQVYSELKSWISEHRGSEAVVANFLAVTADSIHQLSGARMAQAASPAREDENWVGRSVFESLAVFAPAGARLCGICGVILQKKDLLMKDAPGGIYPAKIRETLAYYMLNLTRRGHHGAGVALMLVDRKTGYRTFRLVKMPNSAGHNPFTYRREGGPELTKRLTEEFAAEIDALQKDYDVVDMKLAGHVRLATSAGEQSVRNTQCFHLGRGPAGETLLVEKVRLLAGALQTSQETDELLFAANGDLIRAILFADGKFYDQEKLREFFIRLYGVESGTNDSETAAYLLYFLTTQGIWQKSIVKAYVTTLMESPDAPLPTTAELKRWAALFKEAFEARADRLYAPDSKSLADVRDPDAREAVIGQVAERLKSDPAFARRSADDVLRFTADAFNAFTENDPFTANRQSMKRVSNDSSYGSECFFTGFPDEYVLLSRQQPVALAHNFTRNRTVYGSNSVLAKETMRRFLTEEDDEVKVLRLIPRVRHDGQGGECVRIHNTEGIELYSMLEDRVVPQSELLHGKGETEAERLRTKRWASQTDNPYNAPLVSPEVDGVEDPVEADVKVIPLVARRSLERWADSKSFSRQTFEAFAADFEKLAILKEKLLRGEAQRPADGALDVVLVSFRENMDAMRHFESLLLAAFDPKIFKVRVVQGNDFIKNVSKVPMDEHTLVFFDDPSGSTFPINRGVEYAVEASERARREGGGVLPAAYEEGSELETPATWEMLMGAVKARAGNVYVLANQVEGDAQAATGQQYAPDSPFGARIFTTDFSPAIDGSAAEIVAHVTETEHIFFSLIERLRERFPKGAPLGLTLTRSNMRDLRTEFESKLLRRLPRITGMAFGPDDRPRPLSAHEAPEHAELLRYSAELVPYFLEGAKALVASISHLWLSILLGFSVISLGSWVISLFGLALSSSFLPVAIFTSPLAVLAIFPFLLLEAARYQWFPYGFTLYLRWREGRELFDRTGPRTVVFTDSDWHLTERVQFDDGFGLSRGWTGVNTKNASQTKDLDDEAPNVRRGTIIAMSVPGEMHEATEVDRLVAGSIKSSKIVGAIQSYLRKGPLVVGVGAHAGMKDLGFRHFASIHDKAADRRRAAYDYGSEKNEREAKIILHYSDTTELLVAQSVCYRWRIPSSVASYEVPFIGNVFGYSTLGSQNSSIATTQSPLAGVAIRETTSGEWGEIRGQLAREDEPEMAPVPFPPGGFAIGEAHLEYQFLAGGALRISYDLELGEGPVTADYRLASDDGTGEVVYRSAAGDTARLVQRSGEVFLKLSPRGGRPVYFHAEDTGDLFAHFRENTGVPVGARLARARLGLERLEDRITPSSLLPWEMPSGGVYVDDAPSALHVSDISSPYSDQMTVREMEQKSDMVFVGDPLTGGFSDYAIPLHTPAEPRVSSTRFLDDNVWSGYTGQMHDDLPVLGGVPLTREAQISDAFWAGGGVTTLPGPAYRQLQTVSSDTELLGNLNRFFGQDGIRASYDDASGKLTVVFDAGKLEKFLDHAKSLVGPEKYERVKDRIFFQVEAVQADKTAVLARVSLADLEKALPYARDGKVVLTYEVKGLLPEGKSQIRVRLVSDTPEVPVDSKPLVVGSAEKAPDDTDTETHEAPVQYVSAAVSPVSTPVFSASVSSDTPQASSSSAVVVAPTHEKPKRRAMPDQDDDESVTPSEPPAPVTPAVPRTGEAVVPGDQDGGDGTDGVLPVVDTDPGKTLLSYFIDFLHVVLILTPFVLLFGGLYFSRWAGNNVIGPFFGFIYSLYSGWSGRVRERRERARLDRERRAAEEREREAAAERKKLRRDGEAVLAGIDETLSRIESLADEHEPEIVGIARRTLEIAAVHAGSPEKIFTVENIARARETSRQLEAHLHDRVRGLARGLGLTVSSTEAVEVTIRRIGMRRSQLARDREALLDSAEELELVLPEGLDNASIARRVREARASLVRSGSELLDRLSRLTAEAESALVPSAPLPPVVDHGRKVLAAAEPYRGQPDRLYVLKNVRHLERLVVELENFVRLQAVAAAEALGLDVADHETAASIRQRVLSRREEHRRQREALTAEAQILELMLPPGLNVNQLAQRVARRREQVARSGRAVLERIEAVAGSAYERVRPGAVIPDPLVDALDLLEASRREGEGFFTPANVRRWEEIEVALGAFVEEAEALSRIQVSIRQTERGRFFHFEGGEVVILNPNDDGKRVREIPINEASASHYSMRQGAATFDVSVTPGELTITPTGQTKALQVFESGEEIAVPEGALHLSITDEVFSQLFAGARLAGFSWRRSILRIFLFTLVLMTVSLVYTMVEGADRSAFKAISFNPRTSEPAKTFTEPDARRKPAEARGDRPKAPGPLKTDREKTLVLLRTKDPRIEEVFRKLEVAQLQDMASFRGKLDATFVGRTGMANSPENYQRIVRLSASNSISGQERDDFMRARESYVEQLGKKTVEQANERLVKLFALADDAQVDRENRILLIRYLGEHYAADHRIVTPLMASYASLDTRYPVRDRQNRQNLDLYLRERGAVLEALGRVGEPARGPLVDFRKSELKHVSYSQAALDAFLWERFGLRFDALYEPLAPRSYPLILNRQAYVREHPDHAHDRSAIDSIVALDEDPQPGRPALGLSEEDYSRRVAPAVEAGYGEAVDRLVTDPDRRVRASAASAMAFSGDPHFVPILVGLLSDADPRVRGVAAYGLGRFKARENDNSADPRLAPLLAAVNRYPGDADIAARAREIAAIASTNNREKALYVFDLILNRGKNGAQNSSAIWEDAAERKAVEELRKNLAARPEHPYVRQAALQALVLSSQTDPRAFEIVLDYYESLHKDPGIWQQILPYSDLGPERENALAVLEHLIQTQSGNPLIVQALTQRLRQAYGDNRSGHYLYVLLPLLEKADPASHASYIGAHSLHVRAMSLHQFFSKTWLLWPGLLVVFIALRILFRSFASPKKIEKEAVKKPGVRYHIPEERSGDGSSSTDGARLAVGVLVPKSADRAAFEASFGARFAAFIGKNSGRFRLVYETPGPGGIDGALRAMKARGASVMMDSSSFGDPEAAGRLVRLLAEFDDESFEALFPFVARLTDASLVDGLTRPEMASLFRFLSAALPSPAPRVVRTGPSGAFLDPEVGAGAASAAKTAARELDGLLHRLLVSPETAGSAAPRVRELVSGYLAAYFDGRESGALRTGADLLAGTLRLEPRTRLALYDPSYREDLSSIPFGAPHAPKTIVTDLDVFTKDGGGLPYTLRMERLDRTLPGAFEHALLVRDPSIRDLAELYRRHPETRIFGGRVFFRPGLADVSGLDAKELREDFIVLTAAPGVLTASAKPSGAKTALVLSLSEDSATTVRFLETGARFVSDPDSVPGSVRPGKGGTWLFLPVAAPVDYLVEIERIRARATESAA